LQTLDSIEHPLSRFCLMLHGRPVKCYYSLNYACFRWKCSYWVQMDQGLCSWPLSYRGSTITQRQRTCTDVDKG